MIRIKFWHNACAMLEIGGQRILTDPWLVKASPPFFGAWYHWPPPPDDIIELVGDCDVIWISHCHEDHYHLPSLRAYMRRWGDKPIATATMQERAVADGFTLGSVDGAVTLVAENGIDSALAIIDKNGDSIVNLTDVHYQQDMIDKILSWCNGSPTIALIPFAGAGPWPQTYYKDPEVLIIAAEQKRAKFIERYLQFRDALNAKVNIPFAGQYALGGRLAHLNQWRGMNDAVDMPAPGFVLDCGGVIEYEHGAVSTGGLRTSQHQAPYGLPKDPFTYETEQQPTNYDLYVLLDTAWEKRKPAPNGYGLEISWDNGYWSRHITKDSKQFRIEIDARLLYRLLKGDYHWADADAGSHYKANRWPDVYDKEFMDWLWGFRA